MSQIDLIQGKWCDIVFEGKNKEYGAYQLRKETGKRNAMALLGVIVLIALAVGLGVAYNVYDAYQKEQEEIALKAAMEASALKEKQEKKEEKPVEKKVVQQEQKVVEQKQNTVKFTPPVIKEDNQVDESKLLNDIKKIMDDHRAVGDEDYDKGTDDRTAEKGTSVVAEIEAIKVTELPPPPPAPDPEPEVKVEENKVYDVVEQQPQFAQGNVNAWLAQNIKYPPVAAENGIEGKVVVQFVVGKDGSVQNATVVRGADPSLDREALRVVNSMPKWIPGKQNGQSVNCKYTLPVTFRLQ